MLTDGQESLKKKIFKVKEEVRTVNFKSKYHKEILKKMFDANNDALINDKMFATRESFDKGVSKMSSLIQRFL